MRRILKLYNGVPSTVYKVQVGAFNSKENAEKLLAQLKSEGHQAYIVRV